MNQDLRDECALVFGATGGIGAALVDELVLRGAFVWAIARHPVADLRDRVRTVPVDITDEASIVAACARLAGGVPPRRVIVATGLLHDTTQQPEKSMRALMADDLARSFAVNCIGPALVAKHVLPLLPRTGRCVFGVLSARVGSISDNRIGGWYGYRASKAALNQIVRTLAIETRRTRPETIVVALHPGTVASRLSAPFQGNVSAEKLFSPDVAARHLLRVMDAVQPDDSGDLLAWDGSKIPS